MQVLLFAWGSECVFQTHLMALCTPVLRSAPWSSPGEQDGHDFYRKIDLEDSSAVNGCLVCRTWATSSSVGLSVPAVPLHRSPVPHFVIITAEPVLPTSAFR